MITPYSVEHLFEINESATVSFENNVIYIDNVYKHYDGIMNILNNAAVENWKLNSNSRNYMDYYDCRYYVNNKTYSNKATKKRCKTYVDLVKIYFNDDVKSETETLLRFNYFKHIQNIPTQNFQHFPHSDNGNYNIITYLDPIAEGGTAIYSEYNDIDYIEEDNIFVDLEKYNYKIVNLIQAKPNRCVIFPSSTIHGGYISNHNSYKDNWRINQLVLI